MPDCHASGKRAAVTGLMKKTRNIQWQTEHLQQGLRDLSHRLGWLIAALTMATGLGCRSGGRAGQDAALVAGRQLTLRGIDALAKGDPTNAELYFARALEVSPADERAHAQYADALWRRGAREEAVPHMEQAVALSGGDPQILVRLGAMHLARGAADRAGAYARQAIDANPLDTDALALWGDVQTRQDNLVEALASYHRALNVEPDNLNVRLAVAEIYLRQERPQRSLATLDAVIRRSDAARQAPKLHFLRGLALKRLTRTHAAVESLAEAHRLGDESADCLFELAEAHAQLSNVAAARTCTNMALRSDPEHRQSLELLAWLQRPSDTPHTATLPRPTQRHPMPGTLPTPPAPTTQQAVAPRPERLPAR